MLNSPEIWKNVFLRPDAQSHKYERGHALIYGAPELTGATRLAATACARIGAGLTSVLCHKDVSNIYRTSLPAHIMVRDDLDWDDSRVNVKLYGPGGLSEKPEYSQSCKLVLDAEALADMPKTLNKNTVITPHEGEFKKAFPNLNGERMDRALAAAKIKRCVVVLKGAETIIAEPDGYVVTNKDASPYLASAGTGDVLAGMITGLLAQGMPVFEAACAGVWIHAQASLKIGAGLVASDIPEIIPDILKDFA